jgi:nitrogen permease regulator 2-like protein
MQMRSLFVSDFAGCILLSEFHPVAGSKINVQVPENYVSKEIFDAINVYIIPKPQLQRCILTVNVLNFKIVGYPISIKNQRYARNAFYFNLCFVCDAWARSVQYESVVKKLSEYLVSERSGMLASSKIFNFFCSFRQMMMEDETGFLSKEDNGPKITNFLSKIMQDLNEKQFTTLIEGETTINLKIVRLHNDPPPVLDHQVPIVCEEFKNMSLESWDLTTQQVLPYINGYYHIAAVAAISDVETELVKACIQNLVYYGVVKLLPLLKYNNFYCCTRNLLRLAKDAQFADQCQTFVSLKKTDLPRPKLQKILQFYASMIHGRSLKSLCSQLCPRDFNIDERRLVTFGVEHGLIRTISKYPIFTGASPMGRQKLYNGLNSLDEICCKTGLAPAKIEEDIDSDANVTVLWK